MKMRFILGCVTAAVVGLFVAASNAAVISFNGWEATWPSTQTSADGTHVLLTVLVPGPTGEWTVAEKVAVFTATTTSQEPQTVAITFTQKSPDAAKRLLITRENVTNATQEAWQGFEFALVGGVEGPAGLPHFDIAASFNGPTPFSIAPFTTLTTGTENGVVRSATFGGGEVAAGDKWMPGLISGELVIQTSPLANGSQQFTLLETPIPIPEPAFFAVLAVVPLLPGRRRV